MQNAQKCDIFKEEKLLTEPLLQGIEQKLAEGYLVELMLLRDGRVLARSVKKREITAAH